MSYVRLNGVTKRFGNVVAVNDLNVEIEKGECFAMLGPSGCGKTTTLRMVAGFEDPDEGEISVGETLLSSSRKKYYVPPEKRNFGMVFQAFAVWPHLNVFDNVAFPLQIRSLSRAEIGERTRSAILHTGLEKCETAYPNELSSGKNSASRWRGQSPSIRPSCYWTNHFQTSIRSCARKCASRLRTCSGSSASPSFLSLTTRRKLWRSPTASW